METHTSRADARANRARLLEAAHVELREHGMEAEIKEIAERAGVGIGTLYRNFPTKDDLIVAVAREMFGAIQHLLAQALALDDPVDAVRQVLRGVLETVDRYGDLMELLHRSMPPHTKDQFDVEDPLARMAAIVQKGVDSGVFRPDLDAELAATMLVGTLHPAMMQRLRRTRSLDQIVERRLAMFLRGVRRDDRR